MAAPPADMASFANSQSQGHVAVPHEAASIKLTRGHSCVLCQQRKVRCDKNKPCANCVKAGVECKIVPPQPPRRRKKKPHERELIERLRKYETLLSQNGVDFEPIGQAFKASDPALDEVDEIEHGIEGLKTSPSSTGHDGERNPKWFPYAKGYRAHDSQLRGDSSDESSDGPVIHQAFDKMFDSHDGFPFVIGSGLTSVTELHPPAVQIFQLWQVYLDNVNPLLKVTHTPTLQGQLIEAAANPSKIPRPLEALLFSIYFMAVVSMTDEEALDMFKEEKQRLMSRYHRGTQQALINAGFMKSAELVVLQAFLMYLIAVRAFVDPRSHFCLIGIAVRVANRMGLHQDAEQFGLPPFEVELRRRLWWQIVIFDKRIAEITGTSITAFTTSKGDCKWPLNINDTDLHVNAKDRITPYAGPTEMLFSLTRFELTVAADLEAQRPAAGISATSGKPKFQYGPSPASSDVFTNAARHNLPMAGTDLDGYIKYMEEKYLEHCDNKVPLHLFTFLMTRQAICKLRLIDYLNRGYLQRFPDPTAIPPGPERTMREFIFDEAIRVIELDSVIQAHAALQGFRWYTLMHFPFPAFAFLVTELRYVTSGDLCEKAWATILDNYEKRKMASNLKSPIHTATGGLMLRAWDCHEAAEAQMGRQLTQPKGIALVREVVKKIKAANKAEAGPSSGQQQQRGMAGPPGSSSKASDTTAAGTASSSGGNDNHNYVVTHPPQGHQQPADVDIHSTGSSPPMVSGPGGAGIDSMGGALFGAAGGFDGMSQQMYVSGPMAESLDMGMMDWSSMSTWTGFLGGVGGGGGGGGGYEYPNQNQNMAPYSGPSGPR